MTQFTWIPTFEATTNWLASYEDKQEELIALLRTIGIDKGLDDKDAQENTIPLTEIDPFTFFSLFMKYGVERRKELFAAFSESIFGADFEAPTDFDGVPSAQALKVWLFPYAKDRTPTMITALWQVFHQAKAGTLDDELFTKALAIPNTGYAKLTQCLFYAFPKNYFPIDSQTRPWLEKQNINLPVDNSWGDYSRCLGEIKAKTDKSFYQLSYEAWSSNQAQTFNAQAAIDYLNERFPNTKTETTHIVAFRCLNGKELALDPGKNPAETKKLRLFISITPDDPENYQPIKEYAASDGRNHHLKQHAPSLAVGHKAWSITIESLDKLQQFCDGYSGYIISEPADATYKKSENTMDRYPLNQILYGPPGTGKTYATTNIAVKITDPAAYQTINNEPDSTLRRNALKARYDELVDEKRIVFTTFHQSFAYEDFIEGIRAATEPESGQLRYEVEDGIFKKLCESAESRVTRLASANITLGSRRFWKMSLGNTLEDDDSIFQECQEGSYVLLGWGKNIDFTGCNTRDSVVQKLEEHTGETISNNNYGATSVHTLKNVIRSGDIVVISDGNHKFRAIGEITGDYKFLDNDERGGYQQLRPVKWLTKYEPSLPAEQLFKKSLSQMTLYELKTTTIDTDKLTNLLAPTPSDKGATQPYVIIIDEINRGNISRIFGELITLLEEGKRKGGEDARQVILPYSKKPFSVPPNLYVIGTMNTADKSLAQLDLALRRRFSFVEIPPSLALLDELEVHGQNIAQLLDIINQRIEVLLDRDHLIGHSYFYGLKSLTNAEEQETELARVFSENIIPLLQEYFFDDHERIGWVLNDPAKSLGNQFIQQNQGRAVNELFTSGIAEQLSDRRYCINTEAFSKPEAYRGIVGVNAAASDDASSDS